MRIKARDSLKSNNRVENKRHTNARQPLASYSATGATIPPLSAIARKPCKNAVICAVLLLFCDFL